ncbi:MAG: hypothetical protein JXL80_05570 [Planctomycetes bacterium]|nr:hypothetical protein [Planctomycetota bacterium]
MPFRLWHTVYLIVPAVIALYVAGQVYGDDHAVLAVASSVALIFLAVAVATGVVMGILMVCGKLRMKCPFCGSYGPAGGDKQTGMFMHCPECGLIRGVGFMKWRLVRGRDDTEPDDE